MFLRIFALCALLVSALAARTAAAAPFEIKEGDRVLFLGDTLIEREGTYGYLETALQEQFRDRHFTVRNLGFSADTPLGWSRASFDPAAKGIERLKEQIALVKPTVVFLGYGMAASLQEMTDRRNDPTMNPDPARYGTEPMSAERFKNELGQLMDVIVQSSGPARFVLLSPIQHEDLRPTRPGLPDPARHNALIEQYTKSIEDLAKERSAQFVNVNAVTANVPADVNAAYTTNGIHLSETGYRSLGDAVSKSLGFAARPANAQQPLNEALRAAIIHKNELFFHRWRPANSTYLFGFRKHEQGQNAKEIPEFDPLIEKAEAAIDQLKKATQPTAAASQAPAAPAPDSAPTLPKPDFTVAEGFQIELWAENPLLYKPTQMNWDAMGRLWVASSALYPQIAPGGEATDTILVLEDTDRDGRADKSTVFAGGLLIPTAVQPSYLPRKDGTVLYGCYVGQSTELLFFEDTDGDGKADKKQIILSGFGTEDTHHIIHTLRRGPDRRLYFNQSVYIHSHMETPWGVVRLNSGGVLAWDPRTEKVEVVSKGLWNTWGHQFDQWGQSFQTDGAGSTGITWSFPGAIFAPFEGSRRTMQSISPGSYPKFAGLELISSPHFPADWQTNAITCDFRAHRVVRFGITDLSIGEKPQAGYTTQELPDVVRTSDVAFRPIDVKLGPDGALYVADWSNPVINHGEVDFRDPRRDHTHGRIWRITRKDAPALKWESLVSKKTPELLDRLLSPNLWEKEQARAVLGKRLVTEVEDKKLESRATGQLVLGSNDSQSALPEVQRWFQQDRSDARLREVALLESAFSTTGWGRFPNLLDSTPGNRALIARLTAGMRSRATGTRPVGAPATPARNADRPAPNLYSLPRLARDPNPRVRLEALRVLGRGPGVQSIDLILDAGVNAGEDPFLDHAAWLAINESAHRWMDAITSGQWKMEGREKQLEYGLNAIDPRLAGQAIARLLNDGKIKLNEGPWIELVGRAGGPPELAALFESLIISFGADCCPGRNMTAKQATSLSEPEALRTITALLEAVRVRNVLPEGELSLSDLATHAPAQLRPGLTQLAGYWKTKDALNFLPEVATTTTNKPELRVAAIDALRVLGGAEAAKILASLCEPAQSFGIRRTALTALAAANLGAASKLIPAVLHDATVENEALATWRGLLAVQGGADALARKVGEGTWAKDLPPIPLAAGVRAAREGGRKAQPLLAALTPIAGITTAPNAPVDYKGIAERTKKDGDPAQGELIYRRATTGCTTCHAIGGAGGIVGPSLTSIGASAPLDYIVESMLAPNAKVKEGYNAVTLKLKDGTEATGIQARETAQEVILRNIAGQETVVPKASITGKTDVGSIMPQGLLEPLSERDRLNLYAFLAELGKPGPYDASKGNVARVWRLYPGAQEKLALKQDVTGYVPPAYTNVDGRLSQAALTEMLPMLGDDGKNFYASAQFQVANAGKVRLSLLGINTAWLDGQPLAIASEPNPSPELGVGVHTITVKLDRTALPAVLRAEADGVNFLGN